MVPFQVLRGAQPRPEQLLQVAQWLRRSGARTLAVVLPHAPGRLPEALKRGLAGLDEQAIAALVGQWLRAQIEAKSVSASAQLHAQKRQTPGR